jgi:chemotaxis protein MotB
MKQSDRRPESGMKDRWMVSYMDVLTILLIFFVAVAAKSLARPPNPPAPAAIVRAPRSTERNGLKDVQHKLELEGLDVRSEPRGVVISLPQAILFRPGRDVVDAGALPLVDQIAEVIRRIPNKVSLIGHADPVPIHNRRFRSNWDLAAARGLRLLELLTERYDIAEERLSMASYGSIDPKGPNDTASERAANRRVEILIFDEVPP